ncbi:hypothetical protein AMTR_s00015p00162660 [Amborella trichopoda]|uniref:Uncharacterized protein n=1 Tax=Amborella trichopoda TaxID=13333 RepID=W1PFU0_AMBTC|nr:hypothetical protein AMTR_s00015p00162660 [Amborella trichopoda]
MGGSRQPILLHLTSLASCVPPSPPHVLDHRTLLLAPRVHQPPVNWEGWTTVSRKRRSRSDHGRRHKRGHFPTAHKLIIGPPLEIASTIGMGIQPHPLQPSRLVSPILAPSMSSLANVINPSVSNHVPASAPPHLIHEACLPQHASSFPPFSPEATRPSNTAATHPLPLLSIATIQALTLHSTAGSNCKTCPSYNPPRPPCDLSPFPS